MLGFVFLGVVASFGATATALFYGLPIWLAILIYVATGTTTLLAIVGWVAIREKLVTSSGNNEEFEFGMQGSQS
ncbi:hypothetical protein SuNHUV7_14260 (plasmid) [Pseudoseohaeicola sp. NH-UV-7]|uniref:hypothetical protein n=1 Tax=unclassified Sulfitobacter TaxID=196795 RepID=UPI000E0A7F9A|nr:hypothetical protein [Sulfitobacter sp. JL08]AXI56526.1 hypothetical protein C1J05_20250 [Sulfitobacter sp. JL08]